MKQIIYKEIIIIDDQEHPIKTCNYSESIKELITDKILDDNNQEIVDHIVDDLVNSQ